MRLRRSCGPTGRGSISRCPLLVATELDLADSYQSMAERRMRAQLVEEVDPRADDALGV